MILRNALYITFVFYIGTHDHPETRIEPLVI